jgi:hypothetical protein
MAIDRIDVKPERSGALMRIWEDGSGAPTTYTLVCRGGEWMVDEVETKAGSVRTARPCEAAAGVAPPGDADSPAERPARQPVQRRVGAARRIAIQAKLR